MAKKEKRASEERAAQKWYLVDAAGLPLGRMASKIAVILRGKNKPSFIPNGDVGDFVICINAEKVKLTGNKWQQKKYYRHSGYLGGLKETTAAEMRLKDPQHIVTHAVKGMLPKNRLGSKLLKKLKVFSGAEHTHAAQQPEELRLN